MAQTGIDAEQVQFRLEHALRTLAAMPSSAPRLGIKVNDYGFSIAPGDRLRAIMADYLGDGEAKPAGGPVAAPGGRDAGKDRGAKIVGKLAASEIVGGSGFEIVNGNGAGGIVEGRDAGIVGVGGLRDSIPVKSPARANQTSDKTRPNKLPTPSSIDITMMDEALNWFSLIPNDKVVFRRIVAMRALTKPHTGQHIHSWRAIGSRLGADHRAVMRWHGLGIAMIVMALSLNSNYVSVSYGRM